MADPVLAPASVFCRATLNFASRRGEFVAEPVEIDIVDGRSADLPGWQECGFELVSHVTAASSWDDEELAAVHHREMEELARLMTGCDVALVSNHIKRGPEHAKLHEDLAPIAFVHSDFAAGYDELVRSSYQHPERDGTQRALDRNGITGADVVAAPRLVILQFWRNIGEATMDFPLAFCDSRTVAPSDGHPIQVNDYAGSGVDFEALAVLEPTESSPYRWYAFPELRHDEVVAFRTYDTDLVERGETWFTPHSAFRDPQVEIGNPARSSIELRAICLFE
jgi:hypothetical protein